jgi:metallo-beta-lactamase class B
LSGRGAALPLVALLAGCAAASAPPLSAAPARGGIALAQACDGRDGWSDPAPPARIAANVYYVGTCGITVLLVTSPKGHILIDGATREAAPGIAANIRRLGFDPRDVRWLLSSHEHVDHAGGLAELKRLTGARVAARAEAKAALESGRTPADDPQAGIIPDFKGVGVDRVVTDGETVRVGALALTAHATPGHTSGSTSWSWRSCEGRACRTFVYADSLTAVSADAYRFSDHPARVAPFRATFARVAGLPCDVLLTPHPGASNLFPRLAGKAPLADAGACAAYADAARKRLDERLAREAAR